MSETVIVFSAMRVVLVCLEISVVALVCFAMGVVLVCLEIRIVVLVCPEMRGNVNIFSPIQKCNA
jgi:hypothetical protein